MGQSRHVGTINYIHKTVIDLFLTGIKMKRVFVSKTRIAIS